MLNETYTYLCQNFTVLNTILKEIPLNLDLKATCDYFKQPCDTSMLSIYFETKTFTLNSARHLSHGTLQTN